MPQWAAGCLIEPPVSEPRARSVKPEATAAAEPPDDPPAVLSISKGFLTGPKYEVSVVFPMPNSSILVLPMIDMPVCSRRSTTVAEYGGIKSLSILEAHVVRMPLTQMLSLTAMVLPTSSEVVLTGMHGSVLLCSDRLVPFEPDRSVSFDKRVINALYLSSDFIDGSVRSTAQSG